MKARATVKQRETARVAWMREGADRFNVGNIENIEGSGEGT
jgi:hypothetical protein